MLYPPKNHSLSFLFLSLWSSDLDPTLQTQEIHLELLANAPSSYRLNRVLDLSAIQLPLRQFFQISVQQFRS